ncbi:hypothetical protein E2C01_001764 [Portunus trituberculatus]|uniref:Uncharacterized protein n=1 Tax=Portunus trituberculatus TaxID=210409 RepID=A0A5B7CHI1_PORTR|nr:hypothetical protein [Portunus trituberculatus]
MHDRERERAVAVDMVAAVEEEEEEVAVVVEGGGRTRRRGRGSGRAWVWAAVRDIKDRVATPPSLSLPLCPLPPSLPPPENSSIKLGEGKTKQGNTTRGRDGVSGRSAASPEESYVLVDQSATAKRVHIFSLTSDRWGFRCALIRGGEGLAGRKSVGST